MSSTSRSNFANASFEATQVRRTTNMCLIPAFHARAISNTLLEWRSGLQKRQTTIPSPPLPMTSKRISSPTEFSACGTNQNSVQRRASTSVELTNSNAYCGSLDNFSANHFECCRLDEARWSTGTSSGKFTATVRQESFQVSGSGASRCRYLSKSGTIRAAAAASGVAAGGAAQTPSPNRKH